MKHLLRHLPPVHELQRHERFQELLIQYKLDKNLLTDIVTDELNKIRTALLHNQWKGSEPGNNEFNYELFSRIEQTLKSRFSYTLKNVINASGTIIHTNLGRARLSDETVRHVTEVAKQYSNLEYTLEKGERGSRHTHVEELIKNITGAEAAMVVNNNAAAIYIVLRALASGKEVIVSRGQLVEIGGSFRISAIMEESGAALVEVGTTNKTHLYDYERAINDETKMILKVHTSNFKVIGFTESVDTKELADLAKKHAHIIYYEDLGSGVLYDFRQHGIGDEPVVGEVLKMGADIVSFSGDKLLGGPQAGIIAGKKHLIDQLKKHQLARVLRVDKMTLAALEGTLMHYARGTEELRQIPVIRDLLASKEEIKSRTEQFLSMLAQKTNAYEFSIKEGVSRVGGGTMPEVELPSYTAVLKHKQLSSAQVAYILRNHAAPAIVARIQNDEIYVDLRTVTDEEAAFMAETLASIR